MKQHAGRHGCMSKDPSRTHQLTISCGIRLACSSLKLPHALKKFAKLLINLKIIKIIIIKKQKYKNLKKQKEWPTLPRGWPATPVGFGGGPATLKWPKNKNKKRLGFWAVAGPPPKALSHPQIGRMRRLKPPLDPWGWFSHPKNPHYFLYFFFGLLGVAGHPIIVSFLEAPFLLNYSLWK
jgi:hypothetical protein